MDKLIRVLLADDHSLVRAGIRALLQQIEGVLVVAEASDGRTALQLIERERPNVALLDITMPALNGLEVAARVAKTFPQVRVLLLSMHANDEYVRQALQAGAAGYLLKEAAVSELEVAVKAVARGDAYLSPAAAKRVLMLKQHVGAVDRGKAGAPLDAAVLLTERQREVLQLVAEGKTTKEIAGILDVGIKTIEAHRMQLMDRLDIHDIAGLVRYAIRIGLVSAEQ